MTKQEFIIAHPDFVWWVTVLLLLFLLAVCGVLYRYKHPHVGHEERHQHHGTFMGLAMIAIVLGVIGWVVWAIWHRDFWAMLHTVLS